MKEEILLLGLSYKSNCGDIRNSQLVNLVKSFKNMQMNITIVDPKVNEEEVAKNTTLKALSCIPNNKKYTGPLEKFKSMLKSDMYQMLINHLENKIDIVSASENSATYRVTVLDDKKKY